MASHKPPYGDWRAGPPRPDRGCGIPGPDLDRPPINTPINTPISSTPTAQALATLPAPERSAGRRSPEEKYLAFARRPKRAGSSSRFRGVSFRRQTQRWIAQVYWRGRRYFLGSYAREEEAAAAYNRHAARIIGELAVLNDLDARAAGRCGNDDTGRDP